MYGRTHLCALGVEAWLGGMVTKLPLLLTMQLPGVSISENCTRTIAGLAQREGAVHIPNCTHLYPRSRARAAYQTEQYSALS